MAKIKYAPDEKPLLNKHIGYTFQPNNYGQSMFPSSKSARSRRPNQNNQQQNLQKAVTFWRTMDQVTKQNWNNFAATYPQASRRNPAIFLTGFQLFCKRNHYCFLNHGLNCDFMLAPELVSLPPATFSFSIQAGNNSIDCTAKYIEYFGILPDIGQFVLAKIFPMAEKSAQFFEPITKLIPVQEIFIDGLFFSFQLTPPVPDITFSVYLSKIVHQSVNYAGTKTRYMGCFTPKTFLALTDTPDTLVGQDGKVIIVDETAGALVFGDGGGGGLTCETLADCPIIINIIDTITAIADALIPIINTSIPPVVFGNLYNRYCVYDTREFCPVGWQFPDYMDISAFQTAIGETGVGGGHIKVPDYTYWNTFSPNQDNSVLFNGRGPGLRAAIGTYSQFKNSFNFWMKEMPYSAMGYFCRVYGYIDAFSRLTTNSVKQGLSIRLMKITTTLSNGQTGSMVGNDGKIYRTICIGSQEWMADNSRETQFQNGELIPLVPDNTEWAALNSSGYCYPNNDINLS